MLRLHASQKAFKRKLDTFIFNYFRTKDNTRVHGCPSLLCQDCTSKCFGEESSPEVRAKELHSGAVTTLTIEEIKGKQENETP